MENDANSSKVSMVETDQSPLSHLTSWDTVFDETSNERATVVSLAKSWNLEELRDFLLEPIRYEKLKNAINARLAHEIGNLIGPISKMRSKMFAEPNVVLREPDGDRPETRLMLQVKRELRKPQPDYDQCRAWLNQTTRIRERPVALNWLAYTYLLEGDTGNARQNLEQLLALDFRDTSVYYNLYAIEDRLAHKRKLIQDGLEVAPSLQLLSVALLLAQRGQLDRSLVPEFVSRFPFWQFVLYEFTLRVDDQLEDFRAAKPLDPYLARLLNRIRQYLTGTDEPVWPDPTADENGVGTMPAMFDLYYQKNHMEAYEFWLNCKGKRARETSGWLRSKSKTYRYFGRMDLAIDYLTQSYKYRIQVESVNSNSDVKKVLLKAKKEVETALFYLDLARQDPELFDRGVKLYRESSNLLDVWKSHLDPKHHPNARFPRKVVNFWERAAKANGPRVLTDNAEAGGVIVLLAVSANGLYSQIQSVYTIRQADVILTPLVKALQLEGLSKSANALSSLLSVLSRTSIGENQQERSTMRLRLTAALDNFIDAIGQDGLTQHAASLIEQLSRIRVMVDDRWGHFPDLNVCSADEAADGLIRLNASSAFHEISLTVSTAPGTSPSVLLRVEAVTDQGDHFKLLDDLESFETIVSPENDAIVTMRLRSNGRQFEHVHCRAFVRFDSVEVQSSRKDIPVEWVHSTELPYGHPYHLGKAIPPRLIPQHFFGRDSQIRDILASVESGTQQTLYYIEGLRRTGKSSLMSAVEFHIKQNDLELVPVRLSISRLTGETRSVGQLLFNLLDSVLDAGPPEFADLEIPTLEEFEENYTGAYRKSIRLLRRAVSGKKIFILLDEFQMLLASTGAPEKGDIVQLLELIRSDSLENDNSTILWLFAGHWSLNAMAEHLPESSIWAVTQPMKIDFLEIDPVKQIVRSPVRNLGIAVPDATIRRIFSVTRGHPEAVQTVCQYIYESLRNGERRIYTPHDAMTALARMDTNAPFWNAWCSFAQLSKLQRNILGAYVENSEFGKRMTLEELKRTRTSSFSRFSEESIRQQVLDLQNRQILVFDPQRKMLKFSTYILERYIRGAIYRYVEPSGKVAILIDLANLVKNNEDTTIDIAETRVEIDQFLVSLEEQVDMFDPSEVTVKMVTDRPEGSPAIKRCAEFGYTVIPSSPDQQRKGEDDLALMMEANSIMESREEVERFVFVTGDVDYRSGVIDRCLEKGKQVLVISLREKVSGTYKEYARTKPDSFDLWYLEELIRL